jgi:hypothetical protein
MTVLKPALKVGDQIRQGDVLLVKRQRLGAGAAELPRENGSVVLAHGEVTGHMHQLRGPQVTQFRDDRGHAYVKVEGAPEALVHEEHTAIEIGAGVFEQAVQVEHTPAELRIVAD